MKIIRQGRFSSYLVGEFEIAKDDIRRFSLEKPHACIQCGASVMFGIGDAVIQQREIVQNDAVSLGQDAFYARCPCGERIPLAQEELAEEMEAFLSILGAEQAERPSAA